MLSPRDPESFSAQPFSTNACSIGSLSLQLLPTTGKLVVRGNPHDNAFTNPLVEIIGGVLPTKANTTVVLNTGTVIWRGPDEWLIELPIDQIGTLSETLEAAFYGQHISIVDITDAFSVIRLSGHGARNVLSSGCSLNLNEGEFGIGQCAQSHYCKAAIILNFVDVAPTFDVFVRRSESEYLWQLLQLACQSNT